MDTVITIYSVLQTILSEDNTKVEEVNTQLAYWFQTFRGSMSGENENSFHATTNKVTSLVHATFISSCEKTFYYVTSSRTFRIS